MPQKVVGSCLVAYWCGTLWSFVSISCSILFLLCNTLCFCAVDLAICSIDFAIGARDFAIRARDFAIGARDFAIRARDFAIGARDFAIGARDFAIGARDFAIGARDFGIRARDFAIRMLSCPCILPGGILVAQTLFLAVRCLFLCHYAPVSPPLGTEWLRAQLEMLEFSSEMMTRSWMHCLISVVT